MAAGRVPQTVRSPLSSGRELEERTRGMTAPVGLSQGQCQVLELRYDDGLTQAEIATRLGVPLNTTRAWLCRCLEQLQDM